MSYVILGNYNGISNLEIENAFPRELDEKGCREYGAHCSGDMVCTAPPPLGKKDCITLECTWTPTQYMQDGKPVPTCDPLKGECWHCDTTDSICKPHHATSIPPEGVHWFDSLDDCVGCTKCPKSKTCTRDSQCPGSYCEKDPTKVPPYYCHPE